MSPVAIWWFLLAVLGSAWEMQDYRHMQRSNKISTCPFPHRPSCWRIKHNDCRSAHGLRTHSSLTTVRDSFSGGYLCSQRCGIAYSMAYWRWFTFNIRGFNILQVDVATFSFCVSKKRRCLMLFRFLSVTQIYLIIYNTYGILIFSCSMFMCLVKPQTFSFELVKP